MRRYAACRRGITRAAQIEWRAARSLRRGYAVDRRRHLLCGGDAISSIVGCGGWSKRRTLYGGDRYQAREDSLLDPQRDAARIRAFFVHPGWARRGIGAAILDACERAAVAAGFTRLEMGATLTGVPFYLAKGYRAVEDMAVPLPDGEVLAIVRMEKDVEQKPACRA